jgi:hypothetical protein
MGLDIQATKRIRTEAEHQYWMSQLELNTAFREPYYSRLFYKPGDSVAVPTSDVGRLGYGGFMSYDPGSRRLCFFHWAIRYGNVPAALGDIMGSQSESRSRNKLKRFIRAWYEQEDRCGLEMAYLTRGIDAIWDNTCSWGTW